MHSEWALTAPIAMQLNTAYMELLVAIFNVNGTGDSSSLSAAFSTFTTQCSQNPPDYGFLTYATSVFTPDGAPFSSHPCPTNLANHACACSPSPYTHLKPCQLQDVACLAYFCMVVGRDKLCRQFRCLGLPKGPCHSRFGS